MSKQSIEAGKGHVTLSVNMDPLQRGLLAASQKLQSWGNSIIGVGARIAVAGAGMLAAMAPGLAAFATYEQALADLRAATNPTVADFNRLKTAIEQVASSTGTSLPETTAAFTELVKMGRTAEEVVNGLGLETIRFARVSGMEAATAAATLTGAMNIFVREGMSAVQAMNYISQAADSSRSSLIQISEAFTSGGATMADNNQTMRDTATAIAILSDSQIMAAEAGTGLRRVMTNLSTGGEGEDAGRVAEGLQRIGLSLNSFRGADTRMLPMVEIIDRLSTALRGATEQERQLAYASIGGMYGQNALSALLRRNVDGWNRMQAAMGRNLSIEEKFDIMTNTLIGNLKRLWVEVQKVAVAVGEAMAPTIRTLRDILTPVLGLTAYLIRQSADIAQKFHLAAAGVLAAGIAIIAFGIGVKAAGYAIAITLPFYAFMKTGFGLLTIATWIYVGTVKALTVAWAIATTAATIFWVAASGGAPIALIAIAALGAGVIGLIIYWESVGSAVERVIDAISAEFSGMVSTISRMIQQVWGHLNQMAIAVTSTVVSSFNAMRDAFMAGNFELAFQILGNSLLTVWYQTLIGLRGAWLDIVAGLGDVWRQLTNYVSDRMLDAWGGLQIGFTRVVNAISNIWTSLVNSMSRAISSMTYALEEQWIRMRGRFNLFTTQEAVENEVRTARMEHNQRLNQINNNVPAAFGQTEEQIRAQIEAIRANIDRGQAGPGAAGDPQIAAWQARVQELQQEMEAMALQAWIDGPGNARNWQLPGVPGDGRPQGAGQGGPTSSIFGSFNAQALFGAVGSGGASESPLLRIARLEERQIVALEQQIELQREIARVAGARVA